MEAGRAEWDPGEGVADLRHGGPVLVDGEGGDPVVTLAPERPRPAHVDLAVLSEARVHGHAHQTALGLPEQARQVDPDLALLLTGALHDHPSAPLAGEEGPLRCADHVPRDGQPVHDRLGLDRRSVDDLAGAEEAFIASTVRVVMPIAVIDDITLPAAPGPVSREAGERMDRRIERELASSV